jgi:hypothetical protein
MKKIVLSGLAALTIGTVGAQATQFYTDANGQVFTSAAEGRTPLEISEALMPSKKKSLTIVDEKSPEFVLGKQTHINMKIVADDNSDMWLKAGVRIQGTFENRDVDYADASKTDTNVYDAYLRRVRFEVAAGFNKWTSFVMDVRNDKANYKDDGEEQFNVGDAYVQIKKPFDTSLVNFKLFRAKIDVSRTETVKSARVINYDRPQVADEAAQYITHNRRGTNAQVYGDWEKKVHYQLAFGDGAHSGKFKDASGGSFGSDFNNGVTDVEAGSDFGQTSFFYGGKLVLSPFDGWEEKTKTETYFGQGQHFSIGAAYWKSPNIEFNDSNDVSQTIDHELINLEISAHYKGLFVQAEYFDFDGVVKDLSLSSTATTETGKSNGWYATGEYVIEDLGFVAPYIRYESWDKYADSAAGEDFTFTSSIAGVNWYLMGNSIKAGFAYQQDEYGHSLKSGERTERSMKVTTQFFF